jgi:1-acyl-sn-glycerol-3-phosphate acyltransferase
MRSPLLNFFYAPLAAVVFVAVVLPFCLLIIIAPTLPLRRAIGRGCVRIALLCIGVPLRVRGFEHLPGGPSIAVSNHASYLDGLILTSALSARFTFVVQDGAASWPLVGPTLRRMGVTFVNRSNAREGALQTRALIRRVQEGESLTIFAEGTFKAEPGLMSFKNGAFMIAVRAGVPVVPVAIRGSRLLWGSGNRLPRWSSVQVEILPVISPIGPHKEAETHLRNAVREQILAHCGEPDRLSATAAEEA